MRSLITLCLLLVLAFALHNCDAKRRRRVRKMRAARQISSRETRKACIKTYVNGELTKQEDKGDCTEEKWQNEAGDLECCFFSNKLQELDGTVEAGWLKKSKMNRRK